MSTSLKCPEEVASQVVSSIQNNVKTRLSTRPWPKDVLINDALISDEWLYLDIFIFDFATFLTFRNSSERQVILAPFQHQVASWLHSKIVDRRGDDTCWTFDYSNKPLFFPSEAAEPALTRLGRRLEYYAQAVGLNHPKGENFAVASVFAKLCGVEDLNFIVTVSGHISDAKIRYLKQLKSPTPSAGRKSATEHAEITNLFLIKFQACLSHKPTSWLAKTILGAPPTQMVGYVAQETYVNKFWLTTALWRITCDTIEILRLDYKVPSPTGRHWEFVHFSFSIPDDTGCGVYSITSGPLHSSSRRYRIIINRGKPEIEDGETLTMS